MSTALWRRWAKRWRALTGRRRFEQDMADEMRFHIDAYVDDLVASGVPRDDAMRRARVEFGSVDNARDDCRQAFGLRALDQLQQDLRYAARVLRRAPGFTFTAVATIAICLGANLTIFAVVDAVLLRPLPFPESDRLVSVYNTYPGASVMHDGASLANYYERRGQLDTLPHVAIYREDTATLGEPGATEVVHVPQVSPEFFDTLGTPPALGRSFEESETTYGTNGVAILTHGYWQDRFGGRADIIGQTLRYNGARRVIVGVLPESFQFLSSKARAYVPLASGATGRANRHAGTVDMIARLAPGATLEQAQAEVDARNAHLRGTDPAAAMMDGFGFRSIVVPLRADHVASVKTTLLLMQAGALALLLVAAANLVNLLLIRASGRGRELAVRRALGAARRHVIGEIVVETGVLAAIGGVLGLGVGVAGVRMLASLGIENLPLGAEVAFDARVAAAAAIVAVALALAMALPIAWYYLREHGLPALQAESRSSTVTRGAQRMRNAFLVAQIATAFMLVTSAGLLAVSLDKALAVSPGFRAGNVLTGLMSLRSTDIRSKQGFVQFMGDLAERLEGQPGVAAAGISTNVPFSGIHNKSAAVAEGAAAAGVAPQGIYSYGVTGNYFAALGVPLVEGRFLTAADSLAAARVVVVDEHFARRNWPGQSAIGKRVFQGTSEGRDDEAFTVVGVAGAVKQAGVTETDRAGAVFYPFVHQWSMQVFVVARAPLPVPALAPALRRAVRDLNQDLPLDDVMTMEERVAASLVGRRSPAMMAIVFAAIAALLAAIGTYGVLSYAVAQRTREIGLRMALGAHPRQVRARFLGIALRALAIGGAIGFAGAWAAGRALESLLYGIAPLHPPVLIAAALVIIVIALPACLIPARRAARVSPLDALNA